MFDTIVNITQAGLEEIPGVGEIIALAAVVEKSLQTIIEIDKLIKNSPLILQLYKFNFIYGPDGIIDPCNMLLKSLDNVDMVNSLLKQLPSVIETLKNFIAEWIAVIPEVGPPLQVIIQTRKLEFNELKDEYNKLPEAFTNLFQSPYGLIDKFNEMFAFILMEKLSLDHYSISEVKKSTGFFGNAFDKTKNFAEKSASIALTPVKLVGNELNALTGAKDKLIKYKNDVLPFFLTIQNSIQSLFSLFFSVLYLQTFATDSNEIKLKELQCKTDLSEELNSKFINEKIIVTDSILKNIDDNNSKIIINSKILNSIKKIYYAIKKDNISIVLSIYDINIINYISTFFSNFELEIKGNAAADTDTPTSADVGVSTSTDVDMNISKTKMSILDIPNLTKFNYGIIDLSYESYMGFMDEINKYKLNIKLDDIDLAASYEIAKELNIIGDNDLDNLSKVEYFTFIKLALYRSMLCNSNSINKQPDTLNKLFTSNEPQLLNASQFNGWFYKLFMKANIILYNYNKEFITICNYEIKSLIDSLIINVSTISNLIQTGGYTKFSNSYTSLILGETEDKLIKVNNNIISSLIKQLFYGEKFELNAKTFFGLRDNIIYFDNIVHIQIIYDFILENTIFNTPIIDYFIATSDISSSVPDISKSSYLNMFKSKNPLKNAKGKTIHININNAKFNINNINLNETNKLEFNKKFNIKRENVIEYDDNINLNNILLVVSKEIQIDTDKIDLSFSNNILDETYIQNILLTNTYINFHGLLKFNDKIDIYIISKIGEKQLYLLNKDDFDKFIYKLNTEISN